jgi:aldose 1-epimerase
VRASVARSGSGRFNEGYPIIEISTADTLAAARRRRGLGTEPMTCPPNAFQTGDSVIHLEPGASTTTWGATDMSTHVMSTHVAW